MINALMAVPEVIITSIERRSYARFQYWQRQAVIYQSSISANLYVRTDVTEPEMNWVSGINMQLMALGTDLNLALVFSESQWWVAQSFSTAWEYTDEHCRCRFLTQFNVAQWLENELRSQPSPTGRSGFEV